MMALRSITLFTGGLLVLTAAAFCAPADSHSKALKGTATTAPAVASVSNQPMSKEMRLNVIRALNAEFVFIRKPFPMGAKGLTIKDGAITPSDSELNMMVAQYGPAARPGDRAQITDVIIKDRSIIFELNGGPKKKKKWYQRVEVGGIGGMTPVAPDNSPQNPHGSFVALLFDHHVPEVAPDQLKKMLAPVFDFSALSATEAYVDTLPPKVRDAVKNHHVLVGMNKEMVMVSVGRPGQKVREHDQRGEYEEWIYGQPPQEMQFVRLYGDEVGRVEVMQVNGERVVRTQKEVEVAQSGMAQPQNQTTANSTPSSQDQGSAPSLRRPGEVIPGAQPASGAAPLPRGTGSPDPQAPGAPH